MTIKLAVEKLEANPEFLEWKKENKDSFLSYAFTVLEKDAQPEWQIGYYDRKKDRITSFTFRGSGIAIQPDEEVFKKEDADVAKLDMKKVKVPLDKAMSYADEFRQKKFSGEEPIKIIAILQNIPKLSIVWNMTYITKSFKMLNMKIDACSGKVVNYDMSSLMDLRKE